MLPPDPSSAEWLAAVVASALVAIVGGLHLVRPALVASPGSRWGRAAAVLLSMAAVGVLLAVVVVFGAGMRAERIDLAAGTGYPDGPFAGVLVPDNVSVADDIAVYTAILLLPVAATLAVLAVAVARTPARSGLRIAAGVGCFIGLLACVALVVTDTGPVVAGVATAGVGLFVAAGACLLVDALGFRG